MIVSLRIVKLNARQRAFQKVPDGSFGFEAITPNQICFASSL
jgi:hypothetical protein